MASVGACCGEQKHAHVAWCDAECPGYWEGPELLEGGEVTRYVTEACDCPCHGPDDDGQCQMCQDGHHGPHCQGGSCACPCDPMRRRP